MGGQVQADSASIYLLRGWKGDEEEDVDVDSSGESSEGEIQDLKQHALAVSTAAREPVSSKRLLPSGETSPQATSDAAGQESDLMAAKLRTERDRALREVEQIANQTVIAKQVNAKKGLGEPAAPGESSGAKGSSRLQPRKLKRLDARRFRDHFAAKLAGSKRPSIAEGNGRAEAGSTPKDKVMLNNALEGDFTQEVEAGSTPKDKVMLNHALEPLKGESTQQAEAGSTPKGKVMLNNALEPSKGETTNQAEAGSTPKDKVMLNNYVLEPSRGESTQQAGAKALKISSIEIEEEVVMLHVNLEFEQEKDIELPCNGDCNVARKESFQVFTRKRKQASEGAPQIGVSEKVPSQNRNGLQVENIDNTISEPKGAECTTDRPPESNTVYGRSKRARKHNRQTDYIPWSDFGRLSARRSESSKSETLSESVSVTETDSKRTGSKSSLEKEPGDNNNFVSGETRVLAHPSTNEDIEPEDRENQNDLQSSISISVIEHGAQLPANQSASSCRASGEELEALHERSPRSSSVQDKDNHQGSEVDGAIVQDVGVKGCHMSNGTMDLAEAGSIHRMEVSQSKPGVGHDPDRDPSRHPNPRVQEQITLAPSELGLRKDLGLSMREGTERVSIPNCRQEGNEGVELPKGMTKDDHDSVCNKCKREGKLICCDGKNCKVTFHIDCLDPPLRNVPPNDWYCPRCACKRIFGGMHSVSKGIESIWDVKVVNHGPDKSVAQPKEGDIKRPEAEHEATTVNDAGIIVRAHSPQKSSSNLSSAEKLYFVKYKGVAHAHNIWLGESQVSEEAPKLLISYKKQVEQGKAPQWDSEWSKPFRVIGRRKTMLAKILDVFPSREDGLDMGHCIEWCIKWKNLGYEACTWEPADKAPLNSTLAKKLIEDYESRSAKCRQDEDTCRVGAHSNPKVQPTGMLGDYQSLSEVIEKLLSLWQKHINSIAVNEIHQDRMRIAVGFLLCLLEKFEISKPCFVVVPPLLLGEWKVAFQKWMPTANVVVYAGSKEARKIIQRYEFCNEDGFCMAQIILTNFDTLTLDAETLKELSIEALIIDECQHLKGTKTSKSLRQLSSSYRLLLLSDPIKHTPEDYQYLLQELDGGKDIMPHEDNVTLMQLKVLVNKHIVQEAKQESSYPTEFWVPVQMTAFQLEQYCKLLIDKCDLLVRGKRGDIASSPQELLMKIRECCNHPFLVNPGFQESLTHLTAKELLDFGIGASGKLKLLDTMLLEAKTSNKRVVIITQIHLRAGKVSQMDVLDDYMRQQFGVDSYERLDGGVEKSKKSAAVQRFNALDSKRFVFLLDRRACGSSLKLQSVNCIVIFDSDWNPQTDIQSLLRMYSLMDLEHMTICRFYCTHTVEERVLISARKHSDLDSNYHNFTLALLQKLLRWGASKNFELFDTLSRDKEKGKPTDDVMYSSEIINYFLGKDLVDTFSELCSVNRLWRTALFPRRASQYNKGLPLCEEKDEELVEEEKVSATEFWADLLKERQVEAPDVQVRGLRARKKVQYHEDSFSNNNASQASVEEEDESRRKRRKIAENSDFPSVGKGGKSTSVERNPTLGVDVPNSTVENLERSHISKPCENVERAASQMPKPGAVENAHSPTGTDKGYANRAAMESRIMNESTDTEAINEPTAGAKSEQQQVLLSMKADLAKLCQALQFQADTAGHVEQLLLSVGNFFKLPKERSLLHAVELSLCWLAAEQQHYSIDRRATLSLAESCFGVQLDKIETVYAKLEERWKKRLEQGIQQLQGTRGQEKEAPYGGEQDPGCRIPEQELLRDKHGSPQAPPNLGGSLEGQRVDGQESAAPRDVQLSKQGPVTSVTLEQQEGSASHEAYTSAMPSEGQVFVEQVQVPAGIQAFAPSEPLTDTHRVSLSQQQRSERSHVLINSQKNQIAALELLERTYKQRLKHHYESALSKFSRTASSEEQMKLLEGWRRASNAVTGCFRVIRGNLIKQQHEERGKEHRLVAPQLGRDNEVEVLNRSDVDFSEESIFNSLPQGLRTAIETGDFGSVRTISGLDQINIPSPQTSGALNNVSEGSLVPNLHGPQLVPLTMNSGASPTVLAGQPGVDLSESQVHVAPNAQQKTHLQQRQVHDWQHRRPSALSQELNNSQALLTTSAALQNQQRQHVQPQQQRLPVTHPQSLLTSAQRPSSPIPPPQPSLPQQPQLVPERQQSQPLQQGISMPPRYGHQQNSGSGLILTLPNEVAQPLSVSATYNVPPSSGRASSSGTPAANRTLQNGQPRSNQQYQNDPLAQEFVRLRKEQDKLKTFHESEKDRIKAQFMKELELLSKKYEVMLQEEDSSYTQKASALETNLKKVEMNRRLAEVFRLKNAQDSSNSVNAGQDVRVGASQGQGQNYQQHPAFIVARAPLTSASADLPQTSAVAMASVPLFERLARAPAPSITGAQLAGTLTSPSWQYSQGPLSNTATGVRPQSSNTGAAAEAIAGHSRSILGTSASGSYIEPFRISTQLSIPMNVSVQRLLSPMPNSITNVPLFSSTGVSTVQVQNSQGLNVVPVGSYVHGASNPGNGGSAGGFPTSNLQMFASSAIPQCNTTPHVLVGTIALTSAAHVQQDSHFPSAPLSELSGNAADRLACDSSASERPTPPLANNEESQAEEDGCMISATQNNLAHANPDSLIATVSSVQNNVINGLGSTDSRHFNEGQDHGPSDVICLSDDD